MYDTLWLWFWLLPCPCLYFAILIIVNDLKLHFDYSIAFHLGCVLISDLLVFDFSALNKRLWFCLSPGLPLVPVSKRNKNYRLAAATVRMVKCWCHLTIALYSSYNYDEVWQIHAWFCLLCLVRAAFMPPLQRVCWYGSAILSFFLNLVSSLLSLHPLVCRFPTIPYVSHFCIIVISVLSGMFNHLYIFCHRLPSVSSELTVLWVSHADDACLLPPFYTLVK